MTGERPLTVTQTAVNASIRLFTEPFIIILRHSINGPSLLRLLYHWLSRSRLISESSQSEKNEIIETILILEIPARHCRIGNVSVIRITDFNDFASKSAILRKIRLENTRYGDFTFFNRVNSRISRLSALP